MSDQPARITPGTIAQYALNLADRHPHATAVGIATTGPDHGYACMAIATAQRDRHGQPWTPARLKRTFGDDPDLLRHALELAAIRATTLAHHTLNKALSAE